MFGIGMPELLVILVVALVVLGPKRLPEVARSLGKALAELRKTTSDVVDELQLHTVLDDDAGRRPAGKTAGNAAAAAGPAASPTGPAASSAADGPVPRPDPSTPSRG